MNENFLRKVQAATIVAKTLGYEPQEGETPADIIKTALALQPDLTEEQKKTLRDMLKLSESMGIEVEDKDCSDEELDKMVNGVEDWDHIIGAYDDNELAIVDDETGEEVDDLSESYEINEVLSRAERIRAKARFARTATKREIKTRLALRRQSSSATLGKRARHLAINMLKVRLAKKPLANMSVVDKERVEKLLSKRKALVDRLAMKLMPRVKKIEKDRLHHKTFTQK
jgi:hypothetical protein